MVFPVFHLPILIVISLATLAFGVLVYFRERRNITNKAFFLLALSILLWIVTLCISDHPAFVSQALYWNRATVAAGFLMGIFLLYLVLVFPKEKISIFLFWKIFLTIGGILSVLCLFTDLIVKDIEFYSWGTNIIGGKLFFLSVTWSILNMGAVIGICWHKLKKTTGLEKTQFGYLTLGILLFFITGLTFNMILPAITGTNEFAKYGPYFVLLYIIPIAIAITKYHLFGIKVILTELLVGLMGILLLVFSFLLPGNYKFLGLGIFLLFLIFAYYLVKATHEEERRREEAERLAIKERVLRLEIERLTRAKDQFILSSQHYFRTPLTSVIGYLEMVFDEGLSGKVPLKVKEKLKFAFQSAKELRKRIEESLIIAQFQVGQGRLDLKKTKLEDLVKEVFKKLEPLAKERNLIFGLKLPKKTLPEIKVDRQRIIEVFTNLADNAIKHTSKGKVEIGVEHKKDKNSILFWTKDTGIGMSAEELFCAGETFFERGKTAKKFTPFGKGIGLYLSSLIVKAHQGKLWAESEGVSKGSTFYVELPLK